jgi:uncharacterized membrane protein YoaK (UPF0700 family)
LITRLPTWAFPAAWLLAFGAGVINVVGLLGVDHQVVTHLTGTTSQLGVALAFGDGSDVLRFGGLIGAFVLGCALSGIIVQDSTLRLGRRYGVVMLLQSTLLVLATVWLERAGSGALYLLAAACGLQNAMVTTFSGAVIRTTHVSGMFTDLGIFLGHKLRGVSTDARRLRLCLTVITGFLGGGIVGAFAYRHWSNRALYIPVCGCLILALLHEYAIRRRLSVRR